MFIELVVENRKIILLNPTQISDIWEEKSFYDGDSVKFRLGGIIHEAVEFSNKNEFKAFVEKEIHRTAFKNKIEEQIK